MNFFTFFLTLAHGTTILPLRNSFITYDSVYFNVTDFENQNYPSDIAVVWIVDSTFSDAVVRNLGQVFEWIPTAATSYLITARIVDVTTGNFLDEISKTVTVRNANRLSDLEVSFTNYSNFDVQINTDIELKVSFETDNLQSVYFISINLALHG